MAIPLPIHSSNFNGGTVLLCTGTLGHWAFLPGGWGGGRFTFHQSTEKSTEWSPGAATAAGNPYCLVLNPPGKPALGTL